jgi:hypothetical protein
LQRRQEYLKDVETQSTETRREVANLAERLKDADSDLERMTVRAPISGQVVGMIAQAPGVVIAPGSKLMEIVPAGDKLLIDVQVPITAGTPDQGRPRNGHPHFHLPRHAIRRRSRGASSPSRAIAMSRRAPRPTTWPGSKSPPKASTNCRGAICSRACPPKW